MKSFIFTFCVLNASILSNTFTNAQSCKYENNGSSRTLSVKEDTSTEDLFAQLPLSATILNCYSIPGFSGGPLPSDIGKFSNLNKIRLDNMGLTGTIPSSISSLSLKRLWLFGNDMEGPIPQFGLDTSSSSYPQIYLEGNNFSGTVPEFLKDAVYLKVHNNHFSGNSRAALFGDLRKYVYEENCFDDQPKREDGMCPASTPPPVVSSSSFDCTCTDSQTRLGAPEGVHYFNCECTE